MRESCPGCAALEDIAEPTYLSDTDVGYQAIEGLQVEMGMHLIAAEQPAEWQRMISRLFADDGERERLSSAGRAFTQEHHDWSRCLERMSGWLPGKASLEMSPTCIGANR